MCAVDLRTTSNFLLDCRFRGRAAVETLLENAVRTCRELRRRIQRDHSLVAFTRLQFFMLLPTDPVSLFSFLAMIVGRFWKRGRVRKKRIVVTFSQILTCKRHVNIYRLPFRKRKLNRLIGTKRRIAAFQGQSWQSLRESFGIFPASNVHHVPLSRSLSRDHPYIARLAWNCSTVESHSRGSSRQPHHTRSSIVDYRSSVEKKTLFLKTVEGIRNEGGGNYRTSLSITFSMAFTALLI